MNRLNRILSLILAFCMIATSAVVVASAEEAENAAHLATEEMRCEYANEYEGVALNSSPYGTSLGSNVVGGWAKYENIDFGTGEIKEFLLNVGVAQNYEGGMVSVYIDNLASEPVASMTLPFTGGWHAYTWLSTPINNSEIVGVHDVYLYFTVKRAMGNMMLFKFSQHTGESELELPADIAGTPFEESYILLKELGIVDDVGTAPYGTYKKVTGEQLLKMGAKIMNMPEDATTIEHFSECTDISLTENAQLADAAKLATYIMGYEQIARLEDFESYCLRHAETYHILDDITTSKGILTNGSLMQFACNMLEQEIAMVDSYSQKDTFWVNKDVNHRTVLNYYHEIWTDDGVVDGNMYTRLTGPSTVSNGYVLIDKVKYAENETNASDYLGKRIKYYYKTDDNNLHHLLYIEDYENNIITLKDEDVASYSNLTLRYFNEKDKQKTLKLSNSVDVIYNRGAKLVYTESLFTTFNGDMTLIDNNNDGVYDVVDISNVYDFVVDNISNNTIYELYGTNNINYNDAIVVIYDQYGEELDVSEIANLSTGNVLTVAEGSNLKGSKIYTIELARKNANGVVESVRDGNIVGMNGKEYKLSDTVRYSTADTNICIGDEAVLYLNADNEIALVHFKELTSSYGYLVTVGKKAGIEDIIEVKIFTEDGTMEVYTCRQTMRIDNKSYNNGTEILNKITALKGTGVLVMYDVNSQGYVTGIDFPYDYTAATPTGKESWEKDNTLHMTYSTSTDTSYSGSAYSFSGYATNSGNAIAFCIPPSGTKEYYLVDSANNVFVSGSQYKVKAYSTDVTKLTTDVYILDQFTDDAEFFKVINSIGETSSDNVCYICSLTPVLDETKDAVVTKITYYGNGQLKSVLAEDLVLATAPGLAVGDSVRIKSKNGYANNLQKMYDFSDGTIDSTNATDSFTSARGCRKGTVAKKSGTYFKLAEYNEVYNAAGANIYVYEQTRNGYPISVGSVADILDADSVSGGSKIVLNSYAGKVVTILVIR